MQPQVAVYELEPQQLLAESGGSVPPLDFTEGGTPDDNNEEMWSLRPALDGLYHIEGCFRSGWFVRSESILLIFEL